MYRSIEAESIIRVLLKILLWVFGLLTVSPLGRRALTALFKGRVYEVFLVTQEQRISPSAWATWIWWSCCLKGEFNELSLVMQEQQTPLHIASRLGNVDIVVLLLKGRV